MDVREKAVYTQIHPAKMLSDWGSAAIGLALVWFHVLYAGIVVIILPSVVVGVLIIRYANLEP